MQNEKNLKKEKDQDSNMNMLLFQTILDKLDNLQLPNHNHNPEIKYQEINKHFSSVIQEIRKGNELLYSKLRKPATGDNLNQNVINSLLKLIKENTKYERHLKASLILSGIIFISTIIYSYKYYSSRGDAAKYYFIKKHSSSEVQERIEAIDKDYDNSSYDEFNLKYKLYEK